MQLTGQNNGGTASSAFLLARKCNWLARTCIMNMRNATWAGTQISKVPTRAALLISSYSVVKLNAIPTDALLIKVPCCFSTLWQALKLMLFMSVCKQSSPSVATHFSLCNINTTTTFNWGGSRDGLLEINLMSLGLLRVRDSWRRLNWLEVVSMSILCSRSWSKTKIEENLVHMTSSRRDVTMKKLETSNANNQMAHTATVHFHVSCFKLL